ncbi:ArnT family glycosyltransferase [Microseira wollei]|nr:glycosyltransferase family 39 protein [Microseira wollei]
MNKKLLSQFLKNEIKKPDTINIIILLAIWIAMVILVNPIGDFPLNDDWAYGRSVQSVIEKGDFQISDWTATNLFSQVLWGALFCWPFGFSFTALRFSTLILGLIGVVTTYGLLREINTSYKFSILGALLVAINPIYFELSNTFMNDVPFFAFTAVSLYFLLRGIKYESKIAITFGFLMAGVAILSRQAGLAIPLAFGCAYIMKKGFVISNFVKGFSPTLVGIAIQVGYQKWLQLTMRSPQSYGDQINTLVKEVSLGLSNVFFNYSQITLFSLIYLGLFILPLLILSACQNFKTYSNRQKTLLLIATSFFFVVALNRLISRNLIMPFVGNILVDFGLGPVGLINSYLPQAPRIWIAATAIGLVGAALLLQYLFLAIGQILARNSSPETLEKKWGTTLILSFVVIYFFPLGLLGLTWQGFYDRYLIALLPFLMMMALLCRPNNGKNLKNLINSKLMPLILIMLLIGGGFTIAATHDYLSSNRVLWQALNNLMQTSQIAPERINGGFEFRGWYLCNKKLRNSPDKSINFSCLWETGKEEYVMAFKPIDGYQEIKRYPFSSWMPFTQKNVLVLQKIK